MQALNAVRLENSGLRGEIKDLAHDIIRQTMVHKQNQEMYEIMIGNELVGRKSSLSKKEKEYEELHAKYSKVVKEYRELARKYSQLMNSTTKAQEGPDPLEGNREIVTRRTQAVRIAGIDRSNVSLTWKKPSVGDSIAIVRINPLITVASQNLFQTPTPPEAKLKSSVFSFGQASQLTFAEPNASRPLFGQESH